jgi:CHAT domain-containing protein/tetratricopeptide (TPR) repeat protein
VRSVPALALLCLPLQELSTRADFEREALAALRAGDETWLAVLVQEVPWRARQLIHDQLWIALRPNGAPVLDGARRLVQVHDEVLEAGERPARGPQEALDTVLGLRAQGRDVQGFDRALSEAGQALARGDRAEAAAQARAALDEARDLELPFLELRARRLSAEAQRLEAGFVPEMRRTLALEEELGLWDEARADAEALARVAYARGALLVALEAARVAEDWAGRVADGPGALDLALLHSELLANLGRFDEAHDRLAQVAALDPQGPARAHLLTLQGELAASAGRYTEALGRFADAARDAASAGDASLAVRAEVRLAGVCSELGRIADAEDALARAERWLSSADLDLERVPWRLARGLVALDAGRPREALEHLGQVNGDEPELQALVAEAQRLSGAAWLLLGKAHEAEAALRRSLAAWNADPLKRAWLHTGLGDAQLAQGRLAEARDSFEAALAEAAPIPTLEGTWRARFGLGRCAEEAGDARAASELYARAIEDVEALRSELTVPVLRVSWQGSKRDLYARALALHAARGDVEAAFRVAQAAQARTLLELRDPVLAPSPGEETAELRAAEARVRALDQRLAGLPVAGDTGPARTELERRQQEARAEFERVRLELELADPRQAQLQGLAQGPTIAELRAALGDDERLLQVAVGAEETWLFVIGPDSARVEPLAIGAAELASAVERVLQPIERLARGERDLATLGFDTRAAHELYEALLGPVAGDLVGCRTLWLVRDGPLRRLPFALLVVRREKRPFDPARLFAQYEGCRFLVEDVALAELPIAGLLTARPRERTTTVEHLVIGAPEPWPAGAAELPLAANEARALAASVPSPSDRLLIGSAASEAEVAALLPTARLVHLATHGLLDDRHPAFSRLALAPDDEHDGWLHAHEIERLTLGAERVVLSACETVLDEGRGEGFLGLVRAFLVAGARSVVASAWTVDDAATATLMKVYASHLAAGIDPVQALRAAQIEAMRGPGRPGMSLVHPVFWAGFRHIGPR